MMSPTVAGNATWRVVALPRQCGFSLLGLALTLALTSMIAIWASSQLVQRIEDAAARSTGVWLTQVRQAAADVLKQHFAALAKGDAPQGEAGVPLFADPYAPTVAELRASAHLPADFPERAAMGFAARINIAKSEACPGERCRIDALIYSAKPVLKAGTHAPDLIGIAAVIDAAQGYGGAVWPEAPGHVRGAAFNFPNPLAAGAPVGGGCARVVGGHRGALGWGRGASRGGPPGSHAGPERVRQNRRCARPHAGRSTDGCLVNPRGGVPFGGGASRGAPALPRGDRHYCVVARRRAADLPIRPLATRQQRLWRRLQRQLSVRLQTLLRHFHREPSYRSVLLPSGLCGRDCFRGRKMDRNGGVDHRVRLCQVNRHQAPFPRFRANPL
ncbi:hypothetical protein D3C85_510770 [compost metagenome]